MFMKLFGRLRWGEGREQKFKKLWFITWLYLVPWLTREMWQNDPSVSSEKRSWFDYEYNTDVDSVVSVCVEGCDSIGAVLKLCFIFSGQWASPVLVTLRSSDIIRR